MTVHAITARPATDADGTAQVKLQLTDDDGTQHTATYTPTSMRMAAMAMFQAAEEAVTSAGLHAAGDELGLDDLARAALAKHIMDARRAVEAR